MAWVIVFLLRARVRGAVETEHRKESGLWDEQPPAYSNNRHSRELSVSRHDLVCEVPANAEELGRFRDRERGAHSGCGTSSPMAIGEGKGFLLSKRHDLISIP